MSEVLNSNQAFEVVGTRPNRPDGVDKVTGRARFGADATASGMLHGLILRSPHAHARIISIDTSKAEKAPGVKAVLTSADLPDLTGRNAANKAVLQNVMARETALYDGHAVAAVAATSKSAARAALALIEVQYEILPHVTDVDLALLPGAPLVNGGVITAGEEPAPTEKSNVVQRFAFAGGDLAQGFAEADFVVERKFKTGATHQGYIEPHACLASVGPDGAGELWVTTQGHWAVRSACAALLGMDLSRLRVTASEIGGGFGGKTTVFIEPVALALSRKANRPVKVVMSRDEVFRASGPTASASIDIKMGMTKDGRLVAADTELRFQGGAFGGSIVQMGAMAAFACYEVPNFRAVGVDVLCNRPKLAAYRAPSAPIANFAVESVLDELIQKTGLDPFAVRLKNAVQEGSRAPFGPQFGRIGLRETIQAAMNHPHYKAPLGKNQGRGVASGFWFNFGGNTSVSLNVGFDGTVNLVLGTPDIGGSRASMCMMAAEELGIPFEKVRAVIADTGSIGHNDTTEGSRVTFSTGIATIQAARDAVKKLRGRAAAIWNIPIDAVVWESGEARPAGDNAGKFEALSLAAIAKRSPTTGGPIAGHNEINADGAGSSFGTHIADVEVDPETGAVRVLRYTVIQDAGKAVHPSYVEGQFQGGAAQGIGWALNEEYIYGDDGRLQNAGFLDYRIPVCSDMPMIDTVIVEVPNPGHPYGVRGVGETPIVPPLATIANAIANATGVRMTEVPMSPPRLLKAIHAAKG